MDRAINEKFEATGPRAGNRRLLKQIALLSGLTFKMELNPSTPHTSPATLYASTSDPACHIF